MLSWVLSLCCNGRWTLFNITFYVFILVFYGLKYPSSKYNFSADSFCPERMKEMLYILLSFYYKNILPMPKYRAVSNISYMCTWVSLNIACWCNLLLGKSSVLERSLGKEGLYCVVWAQPSSDSTITWLLLSKVAPI